MKQSKQCGLVPFVSAVDLRLNIDFKKKCSSTREAEAGDSSHHDRKQQWWQMQASGPGLKGAGFRG